MTDTNKPVASTPADPAAGREDKPARTLGNRPIDPNAVNQKHGKVPPGVEPDEVWDPGSNTPGAPPVDNRS